MGGFGRPVEKAKDFKGTLKRLVGYLKPHRMNLIIVLIFAIASTTFTIYAPKVTSRAMNKLQDAYMSRKMMTEMAKGQKDAVKQIDEKMEDAQKEAVDQINSKMIEGQQKAVDQITKSMEDAQVKAVDGIYKGIAVQLYQGVLSGQRAAVDKITAQMAGVQKELVSELTQQMQQGTQSAALQQQMDPRTLEAIQKLMKLPMIDSVKGRAAKAKTVIEFIDILQEMPGGSQGGTASGQMVRKGQRPVMFPSAEASMW
jgi:ABC-type multidrug transport system fused ATPase/permease subunit